MRAALLLAVAVSLPAAAEKPLRISLEVQNADIHSLIRFFGSVSQLNFIAGDEVQGKVTVKLRNVTLEEAMGAVFAARGLGMERNGSIVRVAPLAQLTAEAKSRAELRRLRTDEGPMETTIIPISYASAEQLAPLVKATLSERGTVSVDARTNTLIIRDVAR
jgi:type II secretory pathway component HofQ